MERQPKYPYEPGKFGIPFEKIFENFRNGQQTGTVISGSGREIEFRISKTSLSVCDSEFTDRGILAMVDNQDILTFWIQTEISKLDWSVKKIPWNKHPDMFAKDLIYAALQHFENTNTRTDICRCIWRYFSTNHQTYREEFKRSGDRVKAAKSTWAGQRLIECGFSEIHDKDIKQKNLWRYDSFLQADFHRPSSAGA
jgi:hypothetical protein